MSFTKDDLDKIKNKISLISELERKVKLVKKGKDNWCCCLFHEEKTPSLKINEDLNSFYCFGCGAKGDIFTIYTDLYNYSFQDAVKELADKAGIVLKKTDFKKVEKEDTIKKILKVSNEWFMKNLFEVDAKNCRNYLKKRKLSKETIEEFKLGYSYNSKTSLYKYLKNQSFKDEDIIKSNVVKIGENKKIRDYFYKRLIFPITDERSNILGFGGRSIDNSNPKYLNSPESDFFQKRYLLYNLDKAKISARKKNNLLVCEGYMDVISLYQNGIKSVVAPLGTSITEHHLKLAWKFSSKPTIMFDGDKAGVKAAFKSSLMSLSLINSKNFLQYIILPKNYDPDTFINDFSLEELVKLLKKPMPLVNFIFYQSSMAFPINNADQKVIFDKYLDDLINTIKDSKVKYFYKNEFKSLFFDEIRKEKKFKKNNNTINKIEKKSLYEKQILSFIACFLNHTNIRLEIKEELIKAKLLNENYVNLLNEITKFSNIGENVKDLLTTIDNEDMLKIIKNSLKTDIYQLFPYSSSKYDSNQALKELKESCSNLNTRLLNLEKINKSLNSFVDNSTQLNWQELQKISKELNND